MKFLFEPNEEQLECSHENNYCSYAGEDGAVYECPECGLQWTDADDSIEDDDDDFK